MTLQKIMSANLSCLLVGPPGIGKTAEIIAAAKQCGRRVVIMRASLSDRIDFGGCLVPDLISGTTKTLPLSVLSDLRAATEPTLFFIDDLGLAPVDVQGSVMSLFDTGALSPSVLIWGATNRPADKAGVHSLCEPLRSRFDLGFCVPTPSSGSVAGGPTYYCTWEAKLDSWCEWLLKSYPNVPEIAAWHRSPHLGASYAVGPVLYGWQPSSDPASRFPDFRSWEVVARMMTAGIVDFESISGAIGQGQAAGFLSFVSLISALPDTQQIWIDPEHAPVPTDPGQLCFVATKLGSQVEAKFAGNFCRYIDRMPQMFAALAARDAYKRLGATISTNHHWQSWFVKNQELFAA